MITADGCWADYRTPLELTRGRPCLFLDRDGVLIEDTGYPHVPDAVALVPETLAVVAAVRRTGYAVGIVTNQSGIGRGLFGWADFAAVQGVIDAALASYGAACDFVLACPHHPAAALPAFRVAHPWRKPAPGMILAAAGALALDLHRSVMLGDRASDMAAAAGAGVGRGVLLRSDPGGSDQGGVARRDLAEALRVAAPA